MRKVFLAIAVSLLFAFSSFAQGDSYSVSLMGMYGWNETWKSHAGVDVVGFLPVSGHFEAVAALEAHGPKVCAFTATARPKFQLPLGELFLDGTLHYRSLASYGIADFDIAASVGWRFDYASAQFGLISHWTIDTEHSGSSSAKSVSEPFNMLYRVAFNVRPSSSRWNAGGGMANYTDFEYERTWEPMYFLHGHYNVNSNFSVLARADLKPAGAFHLTAQSWGFAFRAGVKYTF